MIKRIAVPARLLGCLVALSLLAVPAAADETSVADPDDSPGRLDVLDISAGHDSPSPRALIHTITFQDDDPPVDATNIALLVKYRVGRDEWRRALIAVGDNPDGSLYGEVSKRDATPTSYTRAWHLSPDTIAIAFEADQLSPDAKTYKWYVSTSYWDPEDGCGGHGCSDRAPDRGRIVHRLGN